MAYSLYDATVVMAKGALQSLKRILEAAEKHPNSDSFFHARLCDDMNPLTFQVHYATYQAEEVAALLSGNTYSEPPNDLDSYPKMYARIEHALGKLEETSREMANKLGESHTAIDIHGSSMDVPVKALVGSKTMPNIYFHVSMAYAILRKEAVPLAKRDWSRAFVSDYIK